MAYGTRDKHKEREDSLDRRLHALSAYDVLDSDAERGFDEIVFLAKKLCDTPVALISLVEENRQWFKARIGFDACETPIEQSVCQHGLISRELLVIPDLTLDPRTSENTLVTTGPQIRFYAGAPLITPGGVPIGMLCVIDTDARPEGLDADQQRALSALANQVISQLELRKSLEEQETALRQEREETAMLRRAMSRLQLAEEAGEIGAFEVARGSRLISVSREFCRIHGMEPVNAIDIDEFHELVGGAAEVSAQIEGNREFQHGEFQIVRANDQVERWISIRARHVFAEDGTHLSVTGVVSDVTEQRAVNDEISHRLKNTMALVQAIAGHTLRGIADPEPVQEFNRRVSALATAHDILLSRTRAAACLHEVAGGVLSRLSIDDRVDSHGKDVELNSRAVLVLSMLLHELGTNAIKYGALSASDGRIEFGTTLETRDDGDWIVIDWVERGGPEVREPERIGLGTRLLQRGLAPDGETELRYDAEGFSVRIGAPMGQVGA